MQKISTFAEGTQPPLLVTLNGTTKPIDNKVQKAGEPGIDLTDEDGNLDNSYIITYYPDTSNRNEGFRRITIEVIPDDAKQWRVKSRPGYRPARSLKDQER